MGRASDPTVWFDRYSAIPGLLITSTICYLLLALQITGWRGSETFLVWIRANKVSVTVTVQVVSHMLGMIHVQVLCALMRTTFLVYISTKPFAIYLAQFVQAASTPRMTWALPSYLSSLLLLIVLASFFPAALWSGAIAPLPAERNVTQIMEIPTFDIANVSTLWDASRNVSSYIPGAAAAGQWMTEKGLFAFDPASVKYLILPAAADASTLTLGTRKHTKLDKTGYSYVGRSYATGSIAGFNQFQGIKSPNWYSYSEVGLKSKVTCFYNSTIEDNFGWSLVENVAGGWVAQSYGESATGGTIPYTTYWGVTPSDLFSWASTYDNNTRRISLQLSTLANETNDGWSFGDFQNMQCNVDYAPELFRVYTNSTGDLIWSIPQNASNLTWPDYADQVLDKASEWLWEFTRNDGCLGGCQLGRSIRLNVNQLQKAKEDYSNTTVLQGTEDYVASMTDNIMINFLLTRLVGEAPLPTKEVPVTIGVPAIVYGESSFIIAVVVVNSFILILYLVELLRTRAWVGIPPLDLSNTCDLLISASKGGMGYTQSVDFTSDQGRSWKSSTWTYSDQQPFNDKVKMRLQYGETKADMPALVPLLDRNDFALDDVYKPNRLVALGDGQTVHKPEFSETVQPVPATPLLKKHG